MLGVCMALIDDEKDKKAVVFTVSKLSISYFAAICN